MIVDNNKGVLFSVMAFFLMAPFIVLTLAHSEAMAGYGKQMRSLMRVRSGFYYLKAIQEDLGRAGEIIGERSILTLLAHVIETGEPLEDSRGGFREMFLNGTLNNEEIIANFSTIHYWLDEVEKNSKRRGFLLNLTFTDMNVKEMPYKVRLSLDYTIDLKEASNAFSFNKNMSRSTSIDLEGLEDPIFPLNTKGLVGREFKESEIDKLTEQFADGKGSNNWSSGTSIKAEGFDVSQINNPDQKVLILEKRGNLTASTLNSFAGIVVETDPNMTDVSVPYVKDDSVAYDNAPNNTRVVLSSPLGKAWDISNLYNVWQEESYIEGPGPGFFERLNNNLTASGGIETFVKKSELSSAGLEVDEPRSNVANVYFSNESTTNFKIKGMPDSFRLDQTHIDFYNIDEGLKVS